MLKIEVSNPVYEQLKIRCRVKFGNAERKGHLIDVLNKELVDYLSPDLKNVLVDRGFDDSISKTEILNFIDSRTYVEYVTDFSVLQLIDVMGKHKIIDTYEIKKIKSLRTISPYAILTSVPKHHIEVITTDELGPSLIKGIGDLSIESDFVIANKKGGYN